MRLFGWSYPPGCSGPPEYDETCAMCFTDPDRCACPECPKCGEVGNPDCYTKHGLKRTFLQVDRAWKVEDQNMVQCEMEDRMEQEQIAEYMRENQ